jgi:exodeoxyribonuclease V beta subunit
MGVKRTVKPFDAMTVGLKPGVTLVEASAGTGKTFAVTRLVLRLLLEREVESLSQILVVTFTEKATQELITRVRGVLRDADRVWSDAPPERTEKNDDLFRLLEQHGAEGGAVVRKALASLDDLGVSTIHGFCNRVLRESALESRVHFTSAFLEDETEPLQRAAHDWARRELVANADAAALVREGGKDPAEWVQALVRLYRRYPATRIEAGAEPEPQLLKNFVTSVNRTFELEKQRRHLMGYDDLLRTLQAVLQKEGPEGALATRIRERFKVALIDEFQDTDPTQFPIFSTAFHGCPLFLIGDPKQSIYAFRGADVHAYLSAADHAQAHYTLTENYRSTDDMVNAVQKLFKANEQPFRYAADKIGLPDVKAASGVSTRVEVPPPLLADGKRSLEWMWLGTEHATSNRKINKERSLDLAIDAVRKEIVRLCEAGVPGGSIAVLVRKNSEALEFKRALDAARVPAVVGSEQDVLSSEEGEELLLIAGAIARPRDARAVRAALSTRLWGFDASAIAATTDGQSEGTWTAITDDFVAARDTWMRRGVAVALTSVLSKRNAMERLLALSDGERRLTNVRHLIELFQEASATEALPPDAFRAWVNREQQVPNTPERREMRLESDSSAVQILTVHKAKGLEWPVVFCPTLWSTFTDQTHKNPLSVPISLTTDQESGAVLDLASPLAGERKSKASEEELAQDLRVAYVALTRAQSRCYVAWGVVSGAENSALGWLLQGGGDSVREEALTGLVSANSGTMGVSSVGSTRSTDQLGNATAAPGTAFAPKVFSLAAGQFDTWLKTSYSGITAGAHDGDGRELEDLTLEPAVRQRAADAPGFRGFPAGTTEGSALHAMFEKLDFPEAGAVTDEWVAEVLREFGLALPTAGRCTIGDVRRMLETVSTATIPGTTVSLAQVAMDATLREWRFNASVGRCSVQGIADVLEKFGSAHAKAYAPHLRRLKSEAFHGYLNGSIDLAFEHENKWFILDWKSNFLGTEDADYRPEALASQMFERHYTLQYHIYMVALHRHLRARQPGYDPAKHWGGVGYVFLRGVNGRDDCGWVCDTPTPELLDALDRELGGHS